MSDPFNSVCYEVQLIRYKGYLIEGRGLGTEAHLFPVKNEHTAENSGTSDFYQNHPPFDGNYS